MEVFHTGLSLSDPHHILSPRFDFGRSVGTQILPIRLQDGQELTTKVLKHITGTSPIYVRTHKIVNGEDDVRQLFYKDIYF